MPTVLTRGVVITQDSVVCRYNHHLGSTSLSEIKKYEADRLSESSEEFEGILNLLSKPSASGVRNYCHDYSSGSGSLRYHKTLYSLTGIKSPRLARRKEPSIQTSTICVYPLELDFMQSAASYFFRENAISEAYATQGLPVYRLIDCEKHGKVGQMLFIQSVYADGYFDDIQDKDSELEHVEFKVQVGLETPESGVYYPESCGLNPQLFLENTKAMALGDLRHQRKDYASSVFSFEHMLKAFGDDRFLDKVKSYASLNRCLNGTYSPHRN